MRILTVLSLAASLPIAGMSVATAQTTAPVTQSGAMPATNMNAQCGADDPAVVLDKSSKTYTLAPSTKGPRGARNLHSNESGESSSNAAIAASRNSAAQSTMTTVCKSQADAMGAHMSSNSTNPNNH
jgi:hypothetical protein